MFSSAKRSGDEYFSVLGQNNAQPFARLGLAIARKHTKTAVARNRVKRLIRESFRQHQAELSGLDIVVLLRRNIAKTTNQDMFQRLDILWQKIRKQCGAF